MKTVIGLVWAFFATVNVCTANLCLINPQQRGSMSDLNTVGAYDCRLTVKGCGGRASEQPVTIQNVNTTITVTFQKNMDFWIKSNPGYFAVNLVTGNTIKELARVEDNGEPSLFVYTVTGTLPEAGFFNKIPVTLQIQVVYITNNPEAPVFYQCADITLTQ